MVNLAGVIYTDYWKRAPKPKNLGISIGSIQVISNVDQTFLGLDEEDWEGFQKGFVGYEDSYELEEILSKGLTSWQ